MYAHLSEFRQDSSSESGQTKGCPCAQYRGSRSLRQNWTMCQKSSFGSAARAYRELSISSAP